MVAKDRLFVLVSTFLGLESFEKRRSLGRRWWLGRCDCVRFDEARNIIGSWIDELKDSKLTGSAFSEALRDSRKDM
jgi:hypothetical protein